VNREELKEKYGKKRVPREWRGTDLLSTLITTFFGSGMSPKAPGTMGSLAATIVAYPMAIFAAKEPLGQTDYMVGSVNFGWCFNLFFICAALIVFFGAIPFVNKAMKDTATEDPGWIVIDEVCGIFMALAFIPTEFILAQPWILAIAFAIFRFFDILKPLGIHRFEKFPKAWGVMADDLLGGLYAGIVLYLGLVLVVALT